MLKFYTEGFRSLSKTPRTWIVFKFLSLLATVSLKDVLHKLSWNLGSYGMLQDALVKGVKCAFSLQVNQSG